MGSRLRRNTSAPKISREEAKDGPDEFRRGVFLDFSSLETLYLCRFLVDRLPVYARELRQNAPRRHPILTILLRSLAQLRLGYDTAF